jgi:hypothetical protein
MSAKKILSTHKHDWVEVTNNEKFLKRMRNVVGAIKRKTEAVDLTKLGTQQVRKFIREESRVWYCRRCGIIQYSDDLPDE